MKFMKCIVAIALMSWGPSALCVTNGSLDGIRHPNVGVIVAEFITPGVKSQACSGTLISATVFLTAGHCVAILQSRGVTQVWVTFDPVFSPSDTLHSGTMHLNPAFPGRGNSDPEDLAVIVLDAPAVGITPASSAGPEHEYRFRLRRQQYWRLRRSHFSWRGQQRDQH